MPGWSWSTCISGSLKRVLEDKGIAEELYPLVNYQAHKGRTDEISLAAIEKRWAEWERNLPQLSAMSEQQLARGRELREIEEDRRMEAVRSLPGRSNANVVDS